ncbi:MAG: HAMP domain-containing sensor histidine kinase [Alphaproteobacteria bacterium]|nr:HAMP domain-containing sensor histidine kinase [Alphaproteobacteria bacterium]
MRNNRLHLPSFLVSLSGRLLLLTVFFVMLSEVLIYAPSIGRFRKGYFEERIGAAHLASLALEATPDNMVSEDLAQELLDHAGAHSIVLRGGRISKLMLSRPVVPMADVTFDMREEEFFPMIMEAFVTLFTQDNRVLRVKGPSPKDARVEVEILIDEWPMRDAMIDYSGRILALSIVISLITAALVYLSLQLLSVYPMRRITASMTDFRKAPEDLSKVIKPSLRRDEVGIAQRELHDMQVALRAALRQKARLAAVGTAVTKINHDLRAILATASLVSDRIAALDDPEAKRLAPQVIGSVDRAVNLCSQTLKYASEDIPQPRRSDFPLREMVDQVGAGLPPRHEGGAVEWENAVPPELRAEADRDQLFRVLANLGHNAAEAGASKVRFSAKRANGRLRIEVSDNGPGLPEQAKKNLFRPFAGSARNGGTGLGLAIARELVRAHGGELELAETGEAGTIFRLNLPSEDGSAP